MSRSSLMKITLAAVALAAPLMAMPAFAQEKIKVGTLRCAVSGGIGLIITSKKDMICRFRPSRGRSERYAGSIRKFGLDVGATRRGVVLWSVFAPTNHPLHGALAGDYVGASGEVTAGAGVGANALIGGFDRSISLQPISVGSQEGVNFALGVADLSLRHIR